MIFLGIVAFSGPLPAAPDVPPKASAQQPGRDLDTLIRELSNENFRTREKASREIWELGDSALPALTEAVESSDPEQAYRARDLLQKIQLHITPDTDPSVIALVERYHKSSPSEKVLLLGKMKARRAWRQMLKLYGAETHEELREKLAGDINGIAVRAARERILLGDARGAREFLEMAPADAEGLLALAEFHRSHGTLKAELERTKGMEGPKARVWQLALERAAGDFQVAFTTAKAAGQPRIAAAMAAMAGDPLPWLRDTNAGFEADDDPVAAAYAAVATKRWQGDPVSPADLEPLTRSLKARSETQSGSAMNALFLLGELDAAEPAFAKSEPLAAFVYFESLERIPEAFKALGLDPDAPDYKTWVEKRFAEVASDEIEDQHAVTMTSEELVALANFLERRGLHDQAFEAFGQPLADLAETDHNKFNDFLRVLFGTSETVSGAPLLAKRIGLAWAGEDDRHWDDLVVAALGDDEQTSTWWKWLPELDPSADRAKRLDAMLALFGIGTDPAKLREIWLARAWMAVDKALERDRTSLVERISNLVNQTGDVANSFKAWQQLPDASRKEIFWGQHVILLAVLDRWEEAAAVIMHQIDLFKDANQEPSAELFAYAAAALRRAGHEDQAAVHDAWADKLALGNPSISMRIGNGYAYGCDYKRAGEWWARAAAESDPDSGEFAIAMKLHGDALLEDGRWKECAAVSEVVARIYAASDYRWTNPLPFMRQRLQADTTRALGNLENDRAASIALLEKCHHSFASDGSLADFFFPGLRTAGLMEQHDRWFHETWNIMEKAIRKYPESDNTRNTAAWFASRARLKLDAAEKELAVALAANPSQSAYLDTMAEIHFARGQRKKALEWSELAVNFAPDDPQLRRQQDRFRNAPLPK
jgi:tetratricopeptide (TPR) repeat protein